MGLARSQHRGDIQVKLDPFCHVLSCGEYGACRSGRIDASANNVTNMALGMFKSVHHEHVRGPCVTTAQPLNSGM